MKKTLPLFLLVLAGCSTPAPPPVIHLVQDAPPPSARPWSEGVVATYWVGRTTVGADGNVIHEAHPMYRREGAGQPQLATPPAMYRPNDATALATNAAFEEYQALRAETARARDFILKLTHASEALAEQAAAMRLAAETNRYWQQQSGQLLQSVGTLSNRVQSLEQRGLAPIPPNPITTSLPASPRGAASPGRNQPQQNNANQNQ